MADNFNQGQAEAYNTAGSDITHPIPERLGAQMRITAAHPGPLNGEPVVRNTMQSVQYRNGSMEATTPSIVHTPLGGMMPSSAMPPPQIGGVPGAFPIPEDRGEWGEGIADGFPEGCPIPVR